MAEDNEAKRPAAPYIAFSTLKTFIAPLKQHIVPTRIERSLLSNISGTVQGQLMTALRFLRLIDFEDRPTDNLKALVGDFGKETEWKDTLKIVLENAYPEMFRLPLESISPQEFNDAFKAAYPCEGGTLRKSVTFFINAAREAGVGISPFLTKGAKPRSGPVRRKANGAASAKKTTTPPAAGAVDPAAMREATETRRRPSRLKNSYWQNFRTSTPIGPMSSRPNGLRGTRSF